MNTNFGSSYIIFYNRSKLGLNNYTVQAEVCQSSTTHFMSRRYCTVCSVTSESVKVMKRGGLMVPYYIGTLVQYIKYVWITKF